MKPFLENPKTFKALLLCFIVVIYIGLPLLILFGVINFDYKFYALTIGGIIVYILFRYLGFSNWDLGITNCNIQNSIVCVLPITVLLAIIGCVLWIGGFSRITPNEHWTFFIFYIFISSPIQEFLYRGALEAALQKLNYPFIIRMILTSTLYSFVHIIYRDCLTLLLTFLIGLIWYYCYYRFKNLIGVSISHAVLGVVTIVAGIIN